MLNRYLILLLLTLGATACTKDNGTSHGGVTFGNPIFPTDTPVPGYKTYQPSNWHPRSDGGPEDPNTPPNECDCGPGYGWSYNGHNWVCTRGFDREIPAKNNFCNVEH